MSECTCVADHNPEPQELHRHHILPLYMGGPDIRDNLVVICPTTHSNTHRLLRAYEKAQGDPGWEIRRRFSFAARILAKEAWDQFQEKQV